MEQLEQDYINLNRKYTKLKKHAIRNGLAMCLLVNIFNSVKFETTCSNKRDRKLSEGVDLLIEGYYRSLKTSNQFDDLKDMMNIANSFLQELKDETENNRGDFIEKFIKQIKETS